MSFLSPQAFNNLVPRKQKDSRSIVFIDSSLADCESMAQQVILKARAIIIGSEDDGIIAISQILQLSKCFEIHIFSSGYPGCIYLGNSELSLNTLINYRFQLQKWFHSNNQNILKNLPSLHICSPNFDRGDAGNEFLTKLNHLTQAKIYTLVNPADSIVLHN